MLFNSLHFLIFFPIVTALYFLLPHRFRWVLLLAASVYFYMVFRPVYILILVFTIFVDFTAGILIDSRGGPERKRWLLASIFANVGILGFFKYYNFLNDSLRSVLGTASVHDPIPFLNIVLPIGLSFHVFQSMSYTIEVYRGRERAERNLGIFALYVMFYPQLVAGPIERPQNLLWQFQARHTFDYDQVVAGLQLMLWGFIKKVVVADRLAPFVNQVYDHPAEYRAISYVAATVLFAVQIYCDFSGYSDIAIGAAQVMGFKLMKNFDRPYFSRSIAEFWKRWHISLSTWFRDYLYISMGGNRVSRPRWYFNLMVTFTVSGLWHGANWTYVIWGGLNGLYLIGEIVMRKGKRGREASSGQDSWPMAGIQTVTTFVLICFAWLFFRARTLSDAYYMIVRLFTPQGHLLGDLLRLVPTRQNLDFLHAYVFMGQEFSECIWAIFAIILLWGVEYLQGATGGIRVLLRAQPKWARWVVYYAGTIALLFFGAFNHSQQFIYFQF
jgi:D-alanyl-lipoteichoic acid acyltransferase DltB (MBOAT superfamily)